MIMLRILHVVTKMDRAGLENRLMDIYRKIDRTSIQFDFLTFRKEPGYFDEEIKELGGKVFYLDPISITDVCSNNRNRGLCSFFIEHPEYKIIHAHLDQWCGIVLKEAKRAGILVRIAHSRGSVKNVNFNFTMKNIIKNIMMKYNNYYATHRFAVSQIAGEWLFGKRNVSAGNVIVWPNAIDCAKFRYNEETRRRKRIELRLNSMHVLMHIGRLDPNKNQRFLIDIFDELVKKKPNTRLLLIGDDRMDGYYQRYAEQKESRDSILFLGVRSDIVELLMAGDMLIFPSFAEGFPGAVMEAQAAGLTCIISDTITNEVCLTDNIVQLPINNGIDIWVNKILEFKNINRSDNYATLVEKGYDIHGLCQKLSKFYEGALVESLGV